MRLSPIVFFLLAAIGCQAPKVVYVEVEKPLPAPPVPTYGLEAEALNTLLSERYDDTRAVDVYYVTNRERRRPQGGCEEDAYGATVSDSTWLGVCRLNIPKKHAIGEIEVASSPRDDPHSRYRILRHQMLTRPALIEALSDTSRPDVLVLVHGFNVEFQDAVFRAGQIAYDLKFQGPVVLFSWPAGAQSGFSFINRTYSRNRDNAAASVTAAADFFGFLANLNKTTHVLVHSMGSQVVVPALEQVALREDSTFLGEVILNAPDFDLQRFVASAERVRSRARRLTVYCSYNDKAIAASEAYNDGRRLGACEMIDGVDVINVSEIDAPALGVAGLGHSYYASRPILTDVFQILMGIEARNRLFIRRSEPNSTENYYLRR